MNNLLKEMKFIYFEKENGLIEFQGNRNGGIRIVFNTELSENKELTINMSFNQEEKDKLRKFIESI